MNAPRYCDELTTLVEESIPTMAIVLRDGSGGIVPEMVGRLKVSQRFSNARESSDDALTIEAGKVPDMSLSKQNSALKVVS